MSAYAKIVCLFLFPRAFLIFNWTYPITDILIQSLNTDIFLIYTDLFAICSKKLLKDAINGERIIKLELPVVFYEAADIVIKNILNYDPKAVIMTGVAAGRNFITPEVIAVNIADASIDKKAAILATVVLGRMLSGFLPDSVMKKLLTLLTRGLLFS